ncbi:MAG TPA: C4-dicarboxylate ABC transporter permease, partial [Clostridiales bacterium]|nr:C4-dicarboxylate ABC transporter permease [Clostridiales bacterium]
CGSGMATTAAIGGMMIPQMKDKGYKVPYAATLVCFGGTVGPIIPPSLSFVLYGATTKVPVPTLFLAGILPGILIGIGFLVTNYVMCRSMGQDLAIRTTAEKVNIMEAMQVRGKLVWKTFREGFWALLSPVIILGGIYSGIFTPTEAACISVVYSLFVSVFVYKELDMKGVYKTFLAASVINGVTSFLLGYSTVFSTFMTFERVPQAISEFLMTVTESPVVLLLIINAILLVVGCFLDTVPAIIVMAPMLLPTITHFGISPVHFGVIMAVNLAFGLCTPPYGCNLFVGAAVAKISMESMFKYIIPFFIVSIVLLMIITYVPAISLFFIN